MILSPLLSIKVLIARYYRNQHSLLMPVGLTIFVLASVLVATELGLDTANRIVKKHRGSTEVSSKPCDTRFQVWLPPG